MYVSSALISSEGRPKVVSKPKEKKKAKADSGSDYEEEEDDKSPRGKKGKMPKGSI